MDLNSPIEDNFRLAESQKSALKKLGIKTVADLLYHFPVRYGDTSEIIIGLASTLSDVPYHNDPIFRRSQIKAYNGGITPC